MGFFNYDFENCNGQIRISEQGWVYLLTLPLRLGILDAHAAAYSDYPRAIICLDAVDGYEAAKNSPVLRGREGTGASGRYSEARSMDKGN